MPNIGLTQGHVQAQVLNAKLQFGVKILSMNSQELMTTIREEYANNPLLEHEDFSDLEVRISEAIDTKGTQDFDTHDSYDTEAPSINPDEDANERRQRFFDNQVEAECLTDYLLAQVANSDIENKDRELAGILIGSIDDKGYFAGSIPDLLMLGKGYTEEQIDKILKQIQEFDPLGCGARTPKECLLAQMSLLDDSPFEDDIRKLIENHLEDVAKGNVQKICDALDLPPELYDKMIAEFRGKLNPFPGNAYLGRHDTNRVIIPDVYLTRKRNGDYVVEVTDSFIPSFKIAKDYEKMLNSSDKDVKNFLNSYKTRISDLTTAIDERLSTVARVAQEIVDRQKDVFTQGFGALKPLSQQEIAKKLELDPSTISRAVNEKYIKTHLGTFPLSKFFVAGQVTKSGEMVTTDAVKETLKSIIDSEDKKNPLSDEKISKMLAEKGFTKVARRTVAKYRDQMNIPGAKDRKQG